MRITNLILISLFCIALMPACKKEKENLVQEQTTPKTKGKRRTIPANVAGTRYFEGTHSYTPPDVNKNTKTTECDCVRVDFTILTDTTLIMDIHSQTGNHTDTLILSSYLSDVVYHPFHLYFSKNQIESGIELQRAELYCDTAGSYMPRLTHWDNTRTNERGWDYYLLKQMR